MAWTAPTTRATGYLVLASDWNTDLVNNLLYLHGDAGATIDLSAGGQILKATSFSDGPASGNVTGSQSVGVFISSQLGAFFSSNIANNVLAVALTTDTQWRLLINTNGTMTWGPGGATVGDAALSRAAAGQLVVSQKLLEGNPAATVVTVPTTFTPDLKTGMVQRCSVTAGGAAALTIAAPTTPPSATQTALLVVRIANTGGGTITLTWNAAFVAGATQALPASVANGANSMVLFAWNGVNWQILAVS